MHRVADLLINKAKDHIITKDSINQKVEFAKLKENACIEAWQKFMLFLQHKKSNILLYTYIK